MKIPAVEDRILTGFQTQYQRVFGCDLVIVQTTDAIKVLQQRTNGGQPVYPFAYGKVSTIASPETADHYVSRYILRKGIVTKISEAGNTNWNIRLLPTIMNVDITFETNASVGENSVTWYTKRWLMACRMGMFKFAIDIGHLRVKIGITGDLTVNVPTDRPSPSEEETGYKIQTQAQIKGYMSEMQLAQSGNLTSVLLDAQFGSDPGVVEKWDLSNGDQP